MERSRRGLSSASKAATTRPTTVTWNWARSSSTPTANVGPSTWARDDYNLPGYFGNKRWTYYRLATVGQNTLLIDGQNQDPKAAAPIVAFDSTPGGSHAVADLSAAYAKQASEGRRGIALVDRRQVLVQDEIAGTAGVRDRVADAHRGEDRVAGRSGVAASSGPDAAGQNPLAAGGLVFHRRGRPAPARSDSNPTSAS